MNKKEPIIIDDVDVAECIHRIRKNESCTYCNAFSSKVFDFDCSDFSTCYYKQLKRKEQECEELRDELEWVHGHKDKLKAENDELKKIIERLDVPKHEVIDMDIALENEKLKQALQEIKDYCNKYPQNSIGFKKQILQKCEVIDE